MSATDTHHANPPPTSRMQWGRFLGPLLAVVVYLLLPELPEEARRTAGVGTLMAVFWVTEALPLPATSLLPLVLFPALGITRFDEAAAPFAKPVIFLFMGGFMLAMAVERSGLHRRIALRILRVVGETPGRLLAGFMGATALLSMWISNTATTVMMIPIATSIVAMLPGEGAESDRSDDAGRFELCLLLGIAYSASIGGLGTLVGTPPNAMLVGFLHEHGIEVGFGRWMLLAVPLVVLFLALSWLVLDKLVLRDSARSVSIDRAAIREQYAGLGELTRAEWTVLSVFIATAALWIFREPLTHCTWLIEICPWVGRISDASIAIAAAVVLFLLPVDKATGHRALDWESANRLPWGVLILFGGGLSLAGAMTASGLNEAVAEVLRSLENLPPFLLIVAVTGFVIFLTEVASNTATIAALLPVLFSIGADAVGGPLPMMVPATLAASCAFMLPMATGPNAVVFGTGRVSMQAMMRGGLWLNLVGILLIPLAMLVIGKSLTN